MPSISTLLASPGPHLSCEIFPPKAFTQLADVQSAVAAIAALRPAYISVTYGAAGNAPRFTREIAQTVQSFHTPALAHITCINDVVSTLDQALASLQAAGIRNVLALRGDIPEGASFPDGDHFEHAEQLIAYVKRTTSLCVGAACYPEGHPEAPSRDADLAFLRRKVDAGADFLTTQMFFDNNILYNFLSRAARKGIAVPVTAGVMPVVNAKQILRITRLCGAALPPRFLAIVDRFGGDPDSMRQAGVAYATEQIIDLLANGVDCVHLYTMNKPDIAAAIFANLGRIIRKEASL